MKVEARLRELGFKLETPRESGLRLLPAKRHGNLIFVSGHGPSREGTFVYRGKVGAEVSLEEAQKAAELCVVNCLAAVMHLIGDLDEVKEIVKLLAFVSSAPGFSRQPEVVNGASALLEALYGDAGRHARSAIGTSQLPFDIPVEIEMIAAV